MISYEHTDYYCSTWSVRGKVQLISSRSSPSSFSREFPSSFWITQRQRREINTQQSHASLSKGAVKAGAERVCSRQTRTFRIWQCFPQKCVLHECGKHWCVQMMSSDIHSVSWSADMRTWPDDASNSSTRQRSMLGNSIGLPEPAARESSDV